MYIKEVWPVLSPLEVANAWDAPPVLTKIMTMKMLMMIYDDDHNNDYDHHDHYQYVESLTKHLQPHRVSLWCWR